MLGGNVLVGEIVTSPSCSVDGSTVDPGSISPNGELLGVSLEVASSPVVGPSVLESKKVGKAVETVGSAGVGSTDGVTGAVGKVGGATGVVGTVGGATGTVGSGPPIDGVRVVLGPGNGGSTGKSTTGSLTTPVEIPLPPEDSIHWKTHKEMECETGVGQSTLKTMLVVITH